MAIISTRQDLIDHSLRRLGAPVLEINVDIDQLEDKVDDALLMYQEFHGDATHRNYYEYQITASDITNKYITIPEEILFVVKLFPASSSMLYSNNMFSFKYQFAMSDFHTLAMYGGGLDTYYQTMQYMNTLDMTLNGTPQITFSRRQNRLYLWGEVESKDIVEGDYVLIEGFNAIDPEQYTAIYNDMFIRDMTAALIKQQWGQNLSKFEGMQLPGGVTVNGREIREEANNEIEALRERLRAEQELPVDFFIG